MSNGEVASSDNREAAHIGAHVDLGDAELDAVISDGMQRVEELLRSEIAQGADFVTDKVAHLAEAGGKRFRPMFALLASTYGDRPLSDDVIKAAVVVEMTHLSTLFHDDVMDEAQQRRGVPSVNARWSNSVAILGGDYLLALCSQLMSELGPETVSHFATTFGVLVTGQMRETVGAGGANPVEHYMKVIEEKTGVLISSAGFLGGFHSGASPEDIEALQGYGAALGMVFQIVDDFIDIFSVPEESGKTPGTDLREGVFTLPVLYALEEDTPVGEELRSILTGPLTDDATVARALELLGQSSGRERSLADIRHYLAVAEENLRKLPDNSTTKALHSLANFTASRVG